MLRRQAERENEVLKIVDELLTGESIPTINASLFTAVCQYLANLRKEAVRHQNLSLRRKIDCLLPEIKGSPARTPSRACDLIVSRLYLGTMSTSEVPEASVDDVRAECSRLQREAQRQMKTSESRRYKRLYTELLKRNTSESELEEVSHLWNAYREAKAFKEKVLETFEAEKERLERLEEEAEENIIQCFSERSVKLDEHSRFVPSRHLIELRLAVDQMRKAKQIEDAIVTERHMKRIESQERDAFIKKNQLAEECRRRTRDSEKLRRLSEMRAFWQEKKDMNYARAVRDVTRATRQMATLARKLQEKGYPVNEDGELGGEESATVVQSRSPSARLPVSFKRRQETSPCSEQTNVSLVEEEEEEEIEDPREQILASPTVTVDEKTEENKLSESDDLLLSYSDLSSSEEAPEKPEPAKPNTNRPRLNYQKFLHNSAAKEEEEDQYEYEYVSVLDEQTEINMKMSETDKSSAWLTTDTETEYEYVSLADKLVSASFRTESDLTSAPSSARSSRSARSARSARSRSRRRRKTHDDSD